MGCYHIIVVVPSSVPQVLIHPPEYLMWHYAFKYSARRAPGPRLAHARAPPPAVDVPVVGVLRRPLLKLCMHY